MTIFVQSSELNDNFDTLLFFVVVGVRIVRSRRFSVDDRQSRAGYGLLSLRFAANKGRKSLLLGSVGVIRLGVHFLLFLLGVWDR